MQLIGILDINLGGNNAEIVRTAEIMNKRADRAKANADSWSALLIDY